MSPLAACSWGVALGALAASSLFAMAGAALRGASFALSVGVLIAFVLHEAVCRRGRAAVVVRDLAPSQPLHDTDNHLAQGLDFGKVTMDNRARTQVQPTRAKHLQLGSGAYRGSHDGESGAANDTAPVSDSTAALSYPSRMRSPEKAAVRAEVVAILTACVTAHGISNADLGAAINETAEDARRILAGAKPLTADHLLRIARRLSGLWKDITMRLEGAK